MPPPRPGGAGAGAGPLAIKSPAGNYSGRGLGRAGRGLAVRGVYLTDGIRQLVS